MCWEVSKVRFQWWLCRIDSNLCSPNIYEDVRVLYISQVKMYLKNVDVIIPKIQNIILADKILGISSYWLVLNQ